MLAKIKEQRRPDRSGHPRPERPLGPGAAARAGSASDAADAPSDGPMSRTVLVTGGAGFIGSNLARLARRARRPGPDPRRPLDRAARPISPACRTSSSGARWPTRRRSRTAVEGVDAVVHLAARAGIADSVRDPLGTFEVNVALVASALLEAARLAGVRRFVFASSNAAAGDHEPPSDETDLPHPVSPYGASKLAGEAYCQAYAATYGMAACSLRFSNAYGPVLAPQDERRRGLAAGGARGRADHDPRRR